MRKGCYELDDLRALAGELSRQAAILKDDLLARQESARVKIERASPSPERVAQDAANDSDVISVSSSDAGAEPRCREVDVD